MREAKMWEEKVVIRLYFLWLGLFWMIWACPCDIYVDNGNRKLSIYSILLFHNWTGTQ